MPDITSRGREGRKQGRSRTLLLLKFHGWITFYSMHDVVEQVFKIKEDFGVPYFIHAI